MNRKALIATFVLLFVLSGSYLHSAARTFVSGSGDDLNACTIPAPCRSLSRAVATTDPGGEIMVLDSAGYGILTIDKSLTITAPQGIYAGVTSNSYFDAITIAAGAEGKVTLRGLSLNYTGTSLQAGVKVNSAKSVFIDRCEIRGFAGAVSGGSGTRVTVNNSQFIDNRYGVQARNLTVRNCVFEGNEVGVFVYSSGATIVGSLFTGHTGQGELQGAIAAQGQSTDSITVTGCTFSENARVFYSSSTKIHVAESTINRNASVYTIAPSGGQVLGRFSTTGEVSSNTIEGNGGTNSLPSTFINK